jgi:two-component system, NarL family, response regulator NreC
MTTPLRVLLADDHTVVRAGLRALIDSQPDMEVVGEARDGAEVLDLAQRCQAQVTVMDVSMPNLDGVRATQALVGMLPEMRVLVLSVHEEASYLRRVLDSGGAGYVLKRSAADSLIGAIRQVASGGIYLDPALGDVLVQGIVGRPPWATVSPDVLSERETAVLRLIAQGYSNKEIAGQLFLSVKTVETYKARAMEKLGIGTRVDIMRYAVDRGWLS